MEFPLFLPPPLWSHSHTCICNKASPFLIPSRVVVIKKMPSPLPPWHHHLCYHHYYHQGKKNITITSTMYHIIMYPLCHITTFTTLPPSLAIHVQYKHIHHGTTACILYNHHHNYHYQFHHNDINTFATITITVMAPLPSRHHYHHDIIPVTTAQPHPSCQIITTLVSCNHHHYTSNY